MTWIYRWLTLPMLLETPPEHLRCGAAERLDARPRLPPSSSIEPRSADSFERLSIRRARSRELGAGARSAAVADSLRISNQALTLTPPYRSLMYRRRLP